MKYSLLSLLFLLGGCAIQGEVFRLQQRMQAWNALLPQEQQLLFAQNDTNALGLWLDQQESADAAFAEKLKILREDEAIMSFSGAQTAHFFYNTLLKDLAKFSYGELVKALSPEEFRQFISSPDGSGIIAKPQLKDLFQRARSQYEMPAFSDKDILRYHRQKSMPAHLYLVVYDSLAFAAKLNTLPDVLNQNYSTTAEAFNALSRNADSRRPQTRRNARRALQEWKYILDLALVPPMKTEEFYALIMENILPDMDAEVRQKTLANLYARFNIAGQNP